MLRPPEQMLISRLRGALACASTLGAARLFKGDVASSAPGDPKPIDWGSVLALLAEGMDGSDGACVKDCSLTIRGRDGGEAHLVKQASKGIVILGHVFAHDEESVFGKFLLEHHEVASRNVMIRAQKAVNRDGVYRDPKIGHIKAIAGVKIEKPSGVFVRHIYDAIRDGKPIPGGGRIAWLLVGSSNNQTSVYGLGNVEKLRAYDEPNAIISLPADAARAAQAADGLYKFTRASIFGAPLPPVIANFASRVRDELKQHRLERLLSRVPKHVRAAFNEGRAQGLTLQLRQEEGINGEWFVNVLKEINKNGKYSGTYRALVRGDHLGSYKSEKEAAFAVARHLAPTSPSPKRARRQ